MNSSKICKSLVMEVRPRLQSVNVHLILFKPNIVTINLHLDYFEIVTGSLQHKHFCDQFRIVPNSLTCFKNVDNEVTFRFTTENLKQDMGTSRYELLKLPVESCCTTTNIFLLNDQQYSIGCSNCSLVFCDEVKFESVLPLPESTDSNDWYCHSHEGKFSVIPKLTHALYSHCFVYVNPSLLQRLVHEESTLFCDRCKSWIGTKESGAYKIWFNTVTFTNEHDSYSSSALSDCLKTIQILINSPLNSTRLVFKCLNSRSKEDVLLLWILEKNLTVYFDDDAKTTVAKVLYRSESEVSDLVSQWMFDVNVSIFDISKPMLLKLCEHLRDMHHYIPKDFKLSNEFYVSYITLGRENKN